MYDKKKDDEKKIKGKLWECRTCGEKLYTAPWGETYSAFKSNGGRSEKGKRWLKPKNCREGGY